MFTKLIQALHTTRRTIVFTEGPDARILEAASRLLAEDLMDVILVGNVDEVRAAAQKGNFAIDKATILDPAAYPEMDEMVAQTGEARYDEFEGQVRMTRGVVVRHLMLPDALEDSKRAVRMLHERYGTSIRLSIMNQYTPALADAAAAGDAWAGHVLERHPELARRVPDEEYERLLDFADEIGVEDYFWQEGGAAEESFIPPFDLTGV